MAESYCKGRVVLIEVRLQDRSVMEARFFFGSEVIFFENSAEKYEGAQQCVQGIPASVLLPVRS